MCTRVYMRIHFTGGLTRAFTRDCFTSKLYRWSPSSLYYPGLTRINPLWSNSGFDGSSINSAFQQKNLPSSHVFSRLPLAALFCCTRATRTAYFCDWTRPSVESKFGQKRSFGEIPGTLLTISKPNHYPKFVNPPGRKGVTKPNL